MTSTAASRGGADRGRVVVLAAALEPGGVDEGEPAEPVLGGDAGLGSAPDHERVGDGLPGLGEQALDQTGLARS